MNGSYLLLAIGVRMQTNGWCQSIKQNWLLLSLGYPIERVHQKSV